MTRRWKLCEGGYWYDTVDAPDCATALEIARDGVAADNYYSDDDGRSSTGWIDVRVREVCTTEHGVDDDGDAAVCDCDLEQDAGTVTLDPPEPTCSHEGGHDWQAPHKIVGGLLENPGVYGHGGGVTIREVCSRCVCGRVTDTWATRPDTGQQGLRSVSYV